MIPKMRLPFTREAFFDLFAAYVPIVWSVIGGSAAFLLGVSADYVLPVAGAALAVFEWQESQTSSANAVHPLHRPVVR